MTKYRMECFGPLGKFAYSSDVEKTTIPSLIESQLSGPPGSEPQSINVLTSGGVRVIYTRKDKP